MEALLLRLMEIADLLLRRMVKKAYPHPYEPLPHEVDLENSEATTPDKAYPGLAETSP